VESLEGRVVPSGIFTALARPAPNASNTMLLETDGSVLMEGGGVTNTWYRLTPSSSGSYIQGTWSQVASMNLPRLYYASNVLPDGRVLVLGGEYSGALGQQNDSSAGEIYNPVTNAWSTIATYPGTSFGDEPTAMLPGGAVLAGFNAGPQTYVYNPTANRWSAAAEKLRDDRSDEETFLELPDGSILSYDIYSSIAGGVGHAQRYIPSSNTWVDAGTVPVLLSTSTINDELGAAFLLPDGRVWFLGGNGNTAYYSPATNSWTTGPTIPDSLAADDSPGAELPDGKVLFVADTPVFQGPAHIFEFNPATNTYTDLSAALPASFLIGGAFGFRMLMLPSGQVLINNGSSQLYVYTPDLPPVASGVPSISSIGENPDGSFLLTGTLLSGISEGAAYGDDAEMASNYPIVRLTGTGNRVFYARTYGWPSDALATGSTPESTDFTLPPGLPAGSYSVSVVVNGSASAAVSLTVPVTGNDPNPTIAAPAAIALNPVTNTTATLSVLGADPVNGESSLSYTWTATVVPPGAPQPSLAQNATNAAKNDTVSFYRAGTYTFQVIVTNLAGLSSSSSVTVTVNQTLTSLTVSPAPAGVARGGTVQFSVTGAGDQFGMSMTAPATVTWSLSSGGGMLSSMGLYTAPAGGTVATVTATATVTAASAPASGSASVYVLSSPWLTQDVGGVPTAGAAGDDGNGTFTVVGSGQGIGSSADAFRYAYQSMTGDGVIVAHLAGLQSPSNAASAGVVIRADLTAASAMAAMTIGAGGVATFSDRTIASSNASGVTGGPASPAWVKLVRSGATITGFVSTDGSTWTAVGTAAIAMRATVEVGLGVSGGSNASALATATFDQVFLDATPTLVNAASAANSPVTGTSTILAVLGGDEAGAAGLSYSWTATSQPAGASSPTFATNGTNAAQNDNVTFFQAGNYTFTVTITNPGGLSITSSVSVIVVQTPSSVVVTPATASLSTARRQSFTAWAEDQFGALLAIQPVFTWSIQPGGIGGTIDASGLYTRPDPGVGNDTVVASAGTLAGSAAVTVTAGAATQLVVALQPPNQVTAGGGFNVTVQAEDPFGNVDPTYDGAVTLSPVANPGGALIVTAAAGIARFTGVMLARAAAGVTLQAASPGLAGTTTSAINVAAAPATQLVVTAQPAGTVIAGSGFGIIVQAEDPFGNTDPTFAGSVTLSLASNPADAVLGGTLTVTASAGVADFVGLSLNAAGAGEVVQASSSGLPSVNASTMAVLPGAAAQLVVSTQPPSSVKAGQPFGLVVTAEDALGNVQPSFAGSVTVALASDLGGAGPAGTLTVTAVAGVATFTGLTLTKAALDEQLEASASGLASAATASFSVVAAAATQLVIAPSPAGAITAGNGFAVVVSADDPFGNVDPSFAGPVTLALQRGPAGAILDGSTTAMAVSGSATLSNLALDTAGAGYTLRAATAGLASAATGPFSVAPSVPMQLAIVQQPPAGVTAGTSFGLAVVAEDAFGNSEPSFAGSVSLSLADNPGGPGTTLGGPATATAGAGQASFAGLFLDRAAAGYTLQASSGSLSAATTSAITVRAATASQLAIIAQPPPIVTAGSGFGLTVAGEDVYGNVDPTFSGSVILGPVDSPAGSALGGTLTSTASQGVAFFTNVMLTLAGSGNQLEASSGRLGSATTNAFMVAAAPATQLALTVAPPGAVVAGNRFGLVVAAEDPFGNVDPSFAGNVAAALGNNPADSVLGGTLSEPVHQGVATFADLTLDQVAAGATLTLSSDHVTGVSTSAITVGPAAAAQLVVTNEPPARIAAGAGFGLAITAEDLFGNIVPTYGGVVTLASAEGTSALGGALAATPVAGVATFSDLTLDTAGTYTLSASSGGLQAAASTPLTVDPGAAVRLAFLAEPQANVTAGNGFELVALAQDAFGNTVPSFAGSVTATLGNNPAGDALGGDLTATASAGVALFSDLVLTRSAADDTVVVSSGALASATASPLAVVPAAATQLVVSTQPPSNVTAGTPLGLGVAAEDRFGNIASSYEGSVTVALAAASAGTTAGGTLTAPLSAGLATFSDIVLTTAATGVVLQLSSANLSSATTAPLAVTAGPATQLVVTNQPPGQMTAGNGFGVVVLAQDPYGNPSLDYQGSVTVSQSPGANSAGLGGTLTVMADAGVAEFSNLMLTQVGTGETLQVAGSGLATATTNPISVAAAAASQLVVTTEPPPSISAAAPFSLVVEAEDRFGNLALSYGDHVALVLSANPAGDTLGGTVSVAADAGVATFSGLTLNKAATGVLLGASSGTLTSAMTTPLTVTAAAATQLVVTTEPPPSITAGNSFGLVVEAEDPFGNLESSFSGPIALTLTNGAPGAALAGPASLDAEGGVATFSGLTVTLAGTGYTVQAAGAGLTAATANPMSVAAAGATQIVIAPEPPPAVTAGSGFGLVALAEDDFGNVDPSFSGNLSLAVAPAEASAGGRLGGVLNVAATAGVAPFADVMLTRAAAGVVLEVSGSGLAEARSTPIAVNASPADHLVVTAQPPDTVTAGAGFGLIVSAEDPFGNLDHGFHGTVVLTPQGNPPGAPLGGTLSLAASAGLTAFAGLTLDRASSGTTIQVSSPGLAGAASSPITVIAAPATQLVLASEPPSNVDAGAGFGLVALAEDPFGNVDTQYGGTVNLALASNPGGAKLGGALGVTASGGVATFSGLTLDRGGTGYTLVLTGPDLVPATTGPVGVIPPPAHVVAVSVQKQQAPRHKTSQVIVIQFDEPLNAAAAANLGAYMLTSRAPGKKHGTRLLPLARSSYNGVTNTVTLTPPHTLSLNPSVQLRIVASVLTDALGRLLDGNHDGQPGGDFVATLSKAGAKAASAIGAQSVKPLSTHVVDALLSAGFPPRGARARERALP
jgi:hypothetical protein